ncbi:MAG: hypothetical protein PHN39_00250 [Candidatus Pacebacteria bacterium]|nr:hypothetical protein [Candidatus Paceibacterota bacterium]
MKTYVFLVLVAFLTGFVFAPTLGSFSSFDDLPSTLEVRTKPVLVELPKRIDRQLRHLTVLPTHYGPPDFLEGKLTASGTPVQLGSVAVSQDPQKRVLPMGTTFRIEGIRELKDILFVVVDTGEAVGEGQIDIWLDDAGQIKALGDEPIVIHIITMGRP